VDPFKSFIELWEAVKLTVCLQGFSMLKTFKLTFLEKYKEYGVIFIRLIIGFHLIYGTQDNVFSYARMEEFAGFLSARGVPFPLFSAFLSAYAQFICGILIVVGAATRYAAAIMIVNFIAAIFIAHIGDTYPSMFPALMMLAASCFFFVHGAGKLSADSRWEK
jgi:putative oxidoreductase